MNTIRTVKVTRGEAHYFDVEIDGKPLSQHFAGPRGANPSQLSSLGWSSASETCRTKVVAQFLAEAPSDLESGRIPVLVCEDCGDVGCGAITVRVVREGDLIKWTNWAIENDCEPAREVTWPTRPGDFIFKQKEYEAEIRKAL